MSHFVGERGSRCCLGSSLPLGVCQGQRFQGEKAAASHVLHQKLKESITDPSLGLGLWTCPSLPLQVSWRRLCPLGRFWVTPICASCAIHQDRLFLFSVPCSLQAFPSTAVSSPVEESEAGFTGRRLNSKMQVYSGSKTAYLPKMMSLYQQCIRVLSNNIDCKYLSLSQSHCAGALKFWQLVCTDPSSSPCY